MPVKSALRSKFAGARDATDKNGAIVPGLNGAKRCYSQAMAARAWPLRYRVSSVVLLSLSLGVMAGACQGTEGALLSIGMRDDPAQVAPPPPPPPATDAGLGDAGSPAMVVPDAGVEDAGRCVPETCEALKAACGSPSDGCPGTLDCGVCSTNFECNLGSYQCEAANECAETHAAALACQSFESNGNYMIEERNGSVTMVDTPAFEGTQAFSASTEMGDSWARGRVTIPELTSGSLFFRTYLWVPESTVTDIAKIFAFEPSPISPNVDIVLEDDDSIGAFFHGASTAIRSGPETLTNDTWLCLQGELIISDTEGGVRLWLDGDPMIETDQIFDTLPDTGLETVFFGIHWTGPNEDATTVYFDNLVVDTGPIDCL
jgi:hypothetical protein